MGGGAVRTVRLATGVTVPFVVQGDPTGVPVLLLHAWAESMGCFDRLRPLLPPALYVLAFDQRGHGGADKPPGGYGLSHFAADVEAFLDAVELPAAVLAGSSSGGYVAQQVAVTSPQRVLGLVLIGSPASLQGRSAFAEELDRLTDPVDPDWVRESFTWFPRFHDIPDWYVEARVTDGCRLPARVWRDALAGLRALTSAIITTGPRQIPADSMMHQRGGGSWARIPKVRLSRASAGQRRLIVDTNIG